MSETLYNTAFEKYSKDWFIAEGERVFIDGFLQGLSRPPKQTVSEWADQNRRLSSESSAEPGEWNTARAEYQREIMDACGDLNISTVTLMFSAQTGKSECMHNLLGYIIERDPGPVMYVLPTLDMGKIWSTERLAPMLRDTPCLKGRVGDAQVKAKDTTNTKLHKVFPGGHLLIAGANSPATLSSHPIRTLICDEIDRFPLSAGAEGDPVKLATKRTATFWNRKIVLASTPTIKGASAIEKSFEESDKRYYHVPCPHCGEYQVLRWPSVVWEKDRPETARYQCAHCDDLWNDVERKNAVSKGHWVATREPKGHAGFWLWEAYSPWVDLKDTVADFLKAKRQGPEDLKVFVNTSLAELWEDESERVDDYALIMRRETYEKAPPEVVCITAGVDVQIDRIEVDRFGWSLNEQSYGLGKSILYGDPTGDAVWRQLGEVLRIPVEHELYGEMPIMATAVDSGYLTQQVGKFCLPNYGRRIWAIKGIPGFGRPIWEKSLNKLKGAELTFFLVGVDGAKETIYSRLRITDPTAPGYCHFNMSYDEDHFKQLTSEEVKTVYKNRRKIRQWGLKEGFKRNEALDLFVYALAAMESLHRIKGFSLKRLHERNLKSLGISASVPQAPPEPTHIILPGLEQAVKAENDNDMGLLVRKHPPRRR